MIKTYLLNQRLNNSTFTIQTDGGNRVCYQFKGGDIVNRVLPYFMTDDEYYQYVLESSDLFKRGIIKFDAQTSKDVAAEKLRKAQEEAMRAEEEASAEEEMSSEGEASETVAGDAPAENEAMAVVKNVSTVTEAINYVAEKWGEVAKTAKQAKEIALSHGVDFPNLKIGRGK